jgi:hypothetical protein
VATVNKNFRVKNGLVVEGNIATVNGYDILTKSSSDQSYIIDLIGGQATSTNTANAVVKRDGSGNFAAGTITANLTGNVTGNLTGNVTGTVSDISNHDTDDLAEGSSNLYFTNTRARQSISGGTGISYDNSTGVISVTSNTYDAYGAASTAQSNAEDYTDNALTAYTTTANLDSTVDGYGYLKSADLSGYATESYVNGEINSLDTDDIEEGSNLYFTNQRALDATAAAYDAAGAASSAQSAAQSYADGLVNNLDTDDIEEGASNLYFTNGRARNAMGAGTGLSYDSSTGTFSVTANTYDNWGAASAAEAAANNYTDSSIDALDTDDIEEGASNQYFTNTRARGALSAGTGVSYDSSTGVISVDTTEMATQSYVDTAVSNLVDGAPGLLDTLNEIAAAINDDANYFTTISNNLAAKLDLAGGTLTGALTLHADPSSALHAATKQYVDAAESAAQAAAELTAQGALDDVLDGTTDFTALDVSSVSRQVAATTGNIVTAAPTAVLSWNKTDYRSAKILVKAKNGSHTHISEVIVTLDTSDNIALNEYGITTTNGSLMTIDADINSGNVRLLVTPAHNNTEVMAHATLLA